MIEITKENLQELALLVRDELIKTSQGVGDGDVDIVNTLSNINSLLAYQKSGAICKIVEAPLTLLQVGVQRSETHLQWRVGNEVWKDVISLADLMGKDFKFSDFTPEQLALLTLTFDKLTPVEKDSLKLKFSDLTATDIIALQKPATDAAARADEKMVQLSEDVNQIVTATTAVKDLALDVATHPTRIDKDCTVEIYDPVEKVYNKTDINIKGDKGNVMYATFDVDPKTGTLTMLTDPEYTGINFELNENGVLTVII